MEYVKLVFCILPFTALLAYLGVLVFNRAFLTGFGPDFPGWKQHRIKKKAYTEILQTTGDKVQKRYRKEISSLPLKTQKNLLTKRMVSSMRHLLKDGLEKGEPYYVNTHLKKQFQQSERKGLIRITEISPPVGWSRLLFSLNVLNYLGVKLFLYTWFFKQKDLKRPFFKIKFVKN